MGLVGIGVFCLLFYVFVIPGMAGIWMSAVTIVAGVLWLCLDGRRKWPPSWNKRVNKPGAYKHWWVWWVIAGMWFVTFGFYCLDPTDLVWTGGSFLVGVVSAYKGVMEALLSRVSSSPDEKTQNTKVT